MNKTLLPVAALALLALVVIAFTVDCVRLTGQVRDRVTRADEEMRLAEQRLANTVKNRAEPRLRDALKQYEEATDRAQRHAAYTALAAEASSITYSAAEPNKPTEPRIADEVAGAINRRQVAERKYQEERTSQRQWLESFRGRVARRLSSAAEKDAAPGD